MIRFLLAIFKTCKVLKGYLFKSNLDKPVNKFKPKAIYVGEILHFIFKKQIHKFGSKPMLKVSFSIISTHIGKVLGEIEINSGEFVVNTLLVLMWKRTKNLY